MPTFTRRSNGQSLDASHINELQIALESQVIPMGGVMYSHVAVSDNTIPNVSTPFNIFNATGITLGAGTWQGLAYFIFQGYRSVNSGAIYVNAIVDGYGSLSKTYPFIGGSATIITVIPFNGVGQGALNYTLQMRGDSTVGDTTSWSTRIDTIAWRTA